MVDSAALRLSQAIETYRVKQVIWLLEGLTEQGITDLNATHLSFISVLDCADNTASEVARRLNITRQAVHKTVRELEALGYVATAPNKVQRNSKIIQITEKGECLIAVARNMFAQLDARLSNTLSETSLTELHTFLDSDLTS